MNREQLVKQMERVLLRRREALRQSLAGELGALRPTDDRIVGDAADLAVEGDYGEINSRLAEAESRELARIEEALARIRRGEYGRCEACGKLISLVRLQALPYATTCIACQRAAERAEPRAMARPSWRRLEEVDELDEVGETADDAADALDLSA